MSCEIRKTFLVQILVDPNLFTHRLRKWNCERKKTFLLSFAFSANIELIGRFWAVQLFRNYPFLNMDITLKCWDILKTAPNTLSIILFRSWWYKAIFYIKLYSLKHCSEEFYQCVLFCSFDISPKRLRWDINNFSVSAIIFISVKFIK